MVVVVGGGGYCPPITFSLKKGTRTPVFNPMSPLCSLYGNSFHKNLIFPKGITYNPFLQGWGWGFRAL